MKNRTVLRNMKMTIGGHPESSKYPEVWKDNPVDQGVVSVQQQKWHAHA